MKTIVRIALLNLFAMICLAWGMAASHYKFFPFNRISDHWKEKVLPRYAFRLFKLTMLIALYLVVAFLPFLLCHAAALAIGAPFFEFAMSWTGIVFITIVATVYGAVRSTRVTAKL